MAIWVVAIEFVGDDLQPDHPAARRPVLEHAYDLESGLLAHGDDQVRVGFQCPTRGWPMATQFTRCAACSMAVLAQVTGVIANAVGRTATDFTRWAMRFTDLRGEDQWVWVPPPDAPN